MIAKVCLHGSWSTRSGVLVVVSSVRKNVEGGVRRESEVGQGEVVVMKLCPVILV